MYGGAHKLFEYLTPWGDISCIMSIDGKKFDSTFHNQAAELIYDFRYDCLASEYKSDKSIMRFRNIRKQIWSSPLVDIDGHIYRKDTGNTSGQGCTTPDNILKNWLDFKFMWLVLAPDDLKNYESFKKYTRTLFVGDDAIVSVHPDAQRFYNREAILSIAPRINMRYEFEHASFQRFKDVSFIGHRFLYMNVPKTPYKLYLPHIDCAKMRTSLVRYNVNKSLYNSIVRCNGLRAETFACESCRDWFHRIFVYLKGLLPKPYTKKAEEALSTYFSDDQLWELYTNLTLADIYCSTQALPANKIKFHPLNL